MNEDQTTHALAAPLPLAVNVAPATRSGSPVISRHARPRDSGSRARVPTTTQFVSARARAACRRYAAAIVSLAMIMIS